MLLAIETSGAVCGAAFFENGILKKKKNLILPKNSFSKIFDLIDNVLSGKKPDSMAVDSGPGSFTGIRIGVALTRIYGQFLKIPVIGISSLDCIFYTAMKQSKNSANIFPVVDALRNEVYTAEYRQSERKGAYCIKSIQDLKNTADKNTIFAGGPSIIEKFRDKFHCVEAVPDAEVVGLIAAAKMEKGNYYSFDKLLPLYIRLSFAEEKLKKI